MQTRIIRYLGNITLFFFILMLAISCENEEIITTTEESVEIDANIVQKVAEATNDELLKPQLEKELQYMVDREIASVEDIEIYYDDVHEEYEFVVEGDIAYSRDRIQNDMTSIFEKLHRHDGTSNQVYGPLPGQRTIYVNDQVDQLWINAIDDAIDELNSLDMNISFKMKMTSLTSYYYQNTIVYMDSSLPYETVARTTPPANHSTIGRRIRINPDYNNLSNSKAKFAMVHEIGHLIGFSHTDASPDSDFATSSSKFNCVPFSCDGSDNNSVMRAVIANWNGFSYCDREVFECIYN